MADDDFGPTKPKKKHKKGKGKGSKVDADFDAEWDAAPAFKPPPEPIKEEVSTGNNDSGDDTNGSKKKKKGKKGKKKKKKDEALKEKDPDRFKKSTFVEPETTHVIEYGIHHDEIRKQRAEVKAIKEKKRLAREKAKRDEEEAKKKQKELIAAAKAKKKKTVHDTPATRNDLEYGMSEAVLRQREETKKIMQKRIKLREEKLAKLAKTPGKGNKKTPKKTVHSKVETKNELEYGMSEAVIKQRAEIKAIKEKRRLSKLQSGGTGAVSQAVTPDLKKPATLKKKKSQRNANKKNKDKKKNKDNHGDKREVSGEPPKRRLSKLKDKGIEAQGVDIYQTELAKLKEENVELKKKLKMSEFIKKKYELAKNENTLFKEQVNVLNEENDALKAEIAALRKKLEENSIKAPDGFDHDDVIDTHDGDDSTRAQAIDPALLNGAGGGATANGGKKESDDDSDSDEDEDDKKDEPKQQKTPPKKDKDEDSDSDSDSSSDDDEDKPPTKNQTRKPASSDDSDSDSDTDDELPPEEEPDQGDSEEVVGGVVIDKEDNDDKDETNKENANGNNGTQQPAQDEDEDSDDDGAGSASSSSSSEHEWEEWEPPQIANWMLSLDSKYKKYDKVLRKKLAEEEMHGSLLGELDTNDLDRFGIKSLKHKKQILIELKKLTKQPLPEDDTF